MNNNGLFKKYSNRLILEGLLKAFILGFIVGLSASLISAIFVLFVNMSSSWIPIPIASGLLISFAIGLGATLAATPLFYFWFFRPHTKQIAERVDRLGFEERLITMMELEKDSSYIAMRQREDAKQKLAANRSPLKLSLFKIPIIILAIISVCSVSMLTVSALSYRDMHPWQDGTVKKNLHQEGDLILVSYNAGKGGYVVGETAQRVLFGTDATTVIAVADDGYAFNGWYVVYNDDGIGSFTDEEALKQLREKYGDLVDDEFLDILLELLGGSSNESQLSYSDIPESIIAERTDKNVQEEIRLIALFGKLDESDGGQGQDGDNQDQPGPLDGGENGGNPNDGDPSEGAGGRYDEINNVIDNDTYYRDVLDKYYNEIMRKLAEGGNISAEDRAFIELYYKIIA